MSDGCLTVLSRHPRHIMDHRQSSSSVDGNSSSSCGPSSMSTATGRGASTGAARERCVAPPAGLGAPRRLGSARAAVGSPLGSCAGALVPSIGGGGGGAPKTAGAVGSGSDAAAAPGRSLWRQQYARSAGLWWGRTDAAMVANSSPWRLTPAARSTCHASEGVTTTQQRHHNNKATTTARLSPPRRGSAPSLSH